MNQTKLKWVARNFETEAAKKIKRDYNLSHLTSRFVASRIGDNSDNLSDWIHPKLQNLRDPYHIKGAEQVAVELSRRLKEKAKIMLYSDYDVDGITSATLFHRALESLGATETACFIPDRMEEGYGLTWEGWLRAYSEYKPDFVIVLDCGTRSESVLQKIHNETGMEGLIIDHHHSPSTPQLPEGWLIINPHLPDRSQEEYHSLCTVGLSFKVLHALLKKMEEQNFAAREMVNLKDHLDLVAIGTIADLVPLQNENRILTRSGLIRLAKTANPGLQALMKVAQLSTDTPLTSADVAFRIGPRINAGGRIEDALIPLQLLLTKDNRVSVDLAQKLNELNDKRRSIERAVYMEASARISDQTALGIVLGDEKWHPGVVGIVAGRISRDVHRPVIILGWDGTHYKGSGRSIAGVDFMEVMERCSVKPKKWGGHPMAMGLTLSSDQLEDFSTAFAAAVHSYCQGSLPDEEIHLDTWARPEELTQQVFVELEKMGPFGMGNPEPAIGLKEICIDSQPSVFGKDHMRFPLPNSNGIEVIGWRMSKNIPPKGRPIDMVIRLQRNFWRNREFLRAEIKAWKLSD